MSVERFFEQNQPGKLFRTRAELARSKDLISPIAFIGRAMIRESGVACEALIEKSRGYATAMVHKGEDTASFELNQAGGLFGGLLLEFERMIWDGEMDLRRIKGDIDAITGLDFDFPNNIKGEKELIPLFRWEKIIEAAVEDRTLGRLFREPGLRPENMNRFIYAYRRFYSIAMGDILPKHEALMRDVLRSEKNPTK